jgi:hypothetical protein
MFAFLRGNMQMNPEAQRQSAPFLRVVFGANCCAFLGTAVVRVCPVPPGCFFAGSKIEAEILTLSLLTLFFGL